MATALGPQRAAAALAPRAIVHRTRGRRHGPITRLMSPGDLGEQLKPFIFLDLFEAASMKGPGFAPHPHSGIATLTTFLEGRMSYADSTGARGELTSGSIEWMRAGGGVWHGGDVLNDGRVRGYQLWLALPPELESAPPESRYLEPAAFAVEGPVRTLLGTYDGVISPIELPVPITYLHVRLKDRERWTYRPDLGHDVAFLALNLGKLHSAGATLERELAVFAEGCEPIDVVAEGPAEFVVGSAARHPHPLITGAYSVHTSARALEAGERRIAELTRTPGVRSLA